MLKKTLAAILLLTAGFIVVGFRLPAEFMAERSVRVERPASMIYTLLNDFNRFPEWSPLGQRDPDVNYEILVREPGPGAKIAWWGNPREVGSGSLEVLRSSPGRRIDLKIEVEQQGAAISWFALEPEGDSTRVSWGIGMDARETGGLLKGLLTRYFGLIFDSWLGPDLERGLEALKGLAEAIPASDLSVAGIEIVQVSPVPVIFVSGQTSQDSGDVTSAVAEAFSEISRFIEAHDLERSGAPIAITRAWDENGFRFDAAIPVAGELPTLEGRLQAGTSPGGRAVRIIHTGRYADILETYRVLARYLSARGLVENGLSWEEYRTDPASTAPEEAVTAIFVQIEG